MKQREFTIWRKWSKDTPGPSVVVSEHPHRDVLIGYEQIEVQEIDDDENLYSEVEEDEDEELF